MDVEGVLHMNNLEISDDQWEQDVMELLKKIRPSWKQEDINIYVCTFLQLVTCNGFQLADPVQLLLTF